MNHIKINSIDLYCDSGGIDIRDDEMGNFIGISWDELPSVIAALERFKIYDKTEKS